MASPRSRLFLAAALAAAVLTAQAQDGPPEVTVYGAHRGGDVVYHFEIRHRGPGEVRRLFVGCDCRAPEATLPELQVLPAGAALVRTDDYGTWYEAGPETIGVPPGWRARILRPQGTRGYWIEWYRPGAGAAPGGRLTGFTVAVPGGDETYLTARYTVHAEGRAAASAGLQLADTQPPELTLAARLEAEASATAARVHVDVDATDDRDPEPRVVVESVERIAGPSPSLQLVYSATDASGNRATATTRVALPADVERVRVPPTPTLLRRASLP